LAEMIMHYYFYYGVKPLLTFSIWLLIIFIFGVILWEFHMIDSNSFWDAIYFSITNAMTPGYGKHYPLGDIATFFASIEAIFGAFTWGCFLTIFARKYMDK